MSMYMTIFNYRVILKKEQDNGYTAIVPALPGCITYGKNLEQAMSMVKEAIALYILSLISQASNGYNQHHIVHS